jgi:hypothetical protein
MGHGPLFMLGILLFFAGGLTAMTVIFGNGGFAKSKQFQVLGQVLSGSAGRGARRALLIGLCLTALGMCTTFAGVASSDARRAQRCTQTCHELGYKEGLIRGSEATQADHPNRHAFVACRCNYGPQPDPFEMRADAL